MGFKLVKYKELKSQLVSCIEKVGEHHKINLTGFIEDYLKGTPNPKQLKQLAKEHPKFIERLGQIGLMLTILRLLDASQLNDTRKMQVLNAICFYVRDEIYASYNDPTVANSIAAFGTNVNNSQLYVNLGYTLNVDKKNKPNSELKQEIYKGLKNFIQGTVYVDNEPSKGYSDGAVYFLNNRIVKFNLEDFLIGLNAKITKLDNSLICEAPKVISPRTVTPINSGLSMFSEEVCAVKNNEPLRSSSPVSVCT